MNSVSGAEVQNETDSIAAQKSASRLSLFLPLLVSLLPASLSKVLLSLDAEDSMTLAF